MIRTVGGEPPAMSALAPKLGPLGMVSVTFLTLLLAQIFSRVSHILLACRRARKRSVTMSKKVCFC
jgi:hypothetical protein